MVTRYFQKLLPIILFVFLCQLAQAGGPMGGEIRYMYLNTSGDYEVTLVLYQTPSTNASNQPVEVLLNSTCYGSDTLLMSPFVPSGMIGTASRGVRFSAGVNCGDTVAIDSLQPLAFYYRDTVTLPGNCPDYSFSYQQCCRDSVIDNISSPENTAFYLQANLNNTIGQNTSPEFFGLPRFKYYKDIISHDDGMYVYEPNSDSVAYRLASAKDSSGRNVVYTSGYSAVQPFASQFLFDYGISPTHSGEYTVVVEVAEYRFDTVLALWLNVGTSIREITYLVEDTFPSNVVSSAFGDPNVMDTIRNVYCDDTIISLAIEPFYALSLAPDGSQFRIIGLDNIARPVVGVGCYNVNTALMCDSVWLKLHRPPAVNDTFFIQLKNDGSLVNACGNEFIDSVLDVLIITGCQLTSLNENLGSNFFSIYPNPTKDKITVEFEDGEVPELISLFDLQGRELKALKPQSSKVELDISKLSKGMYLLKVKTKGLEQSRLIQKL